jgi:hypothetical protein
MRIRILIFLCRSGFFIDADPDPNFHPDPDPDPNPSIQIKAQTLEKVLKYLAHIPYILACHLQIDPDPVPDPAITLVRMRIQIFI